MEKNGFKLVALGIIKVAALLILIQLIQNLVFIPLKALSSKFWSQYDGRGLNEPWFLTSTFAILLITVFTCYVFIRFIDKKNWAYIRLVSKNRFKYFSAGVLVSFLLISFFTIVITSLNAVELNIEIKSISNIFIYLIILSIGLFSLILSEELIFRGYVLKTFESHISILNAIILTSFLFSIFHILRPNTSFLGFVNIFLLGCFVAIICIYYDNLWLPIGLHFGWNFFLWFFNFPISGQKYPNPIFILKYNEYSLLSGSKFGPEDSLMITPFIILFIFYFLLKLKMIKY